MKIPNSFKEAIASNFYDKEFTVNKISTVKENDGGVYETTAFFKKIDGNSYPINKETMLKEFGLDIEGEIAFSTHETFDDGQYKIGNYRIVKVLPYDSHTVLIGKLWK